MEVEMIVQTRLDELHKLYSKKKEYRQTPTATIHSLQDQHQEHKVQSEQRHDDLNTKYQRQIQQAQPAEGQSQNLDREVTALRRGRDAKVKVIEKVPKLEQKADSPDSESNGSDKLHTSQSLIYQNLPALEPDLETASNPSLQSNRDSQPIQCSQDDIRSVYERDVSYMYRCGYCSKGFYDKNRLIDHLRVHIEERPFQCPICDKAFKKKFVLKRHMITHSDERPFQCTLCARAFKHKGDLNRHMFTHSDEKPFKCTHCEASFKRNSILTTHLLTHLDNIECHFCGERFKTQMKFRAHVGRFHRNNRPGQCTQCDTTFKWKWNLKHHIRSEHEKVVIYRCSHCSEGFYLRGRFTAHLQHCATRHSNESP